MAISSPFETVHEQFGANFQDFDGWRLPNDYGDGGAESQAILAGCAAIDLSSFGKIQVKGSESGEFIAKLTGSAVEMENKTWIWTQIAAEHGDASGKIRLSLCDGIYTLFIMPEKRDSAVQLVEKLAPAEVTIVDITEKTGMMGIYGENAIRAVANILPFEVDGIAKGGLMSMSLFMMNIVIIRGSWAGVDGLELLCPRSACGMAAGAVAKYKDREGITPAGMEALLGAMDKA